MYISRSTSRFSYGIATVVIIFTFGSVNSTQQANESTTILKTNEDREERLSYTCRGRCGDVYLICSCHAFCLVYKNCCENITQDCPGIVSEGIKRYSPLLDAKVTCAEEKVFHVSSCPSGDKTTDVTPSSLSTETPDDGLDIDRSEIMTINNGTVLNAHLVFNTPVTDSASSITFINSRVFECYTKLGFTSKPLFWAVSFETSTVEGSVTFSFKRPYKPTFEFKGLHLHACPRKVIDSCENGAHNTDFTDSTRDYYAERCKKFAGYVLATQTETVYRNRFCAFCHEGVHSSMNLHQFYFQRSVGLSILVSLTKSGTIKLETTHSSAKWTKLCSNLDALLTVVAGDDSQGKNLNDGAIDEETKQISQPQCLDQCNVDKQFTARSDGLCKADQYIKMAFSHDAHSPIPCWTELVRAARFTTCVFDMDGSKFGNADFASPEVSVAEDSRSGKTLYVINFAFASDEEPTNMIADFNSITNIRNFAIAIKAYQTYRYFHSMCPSVPDPDLRLTEEKDRIHSWDFAQINGQRYLHFMKTLRGNVIDSDNITTICASKMSLSPEFLSLQCLEDMVYEQDEAQMLDLLNSTCVRYLEEGYAESPARRNTAGSDYFFSLSLLCSMSTIASVLQ